MKQIEALIFTVSLKEIRFLTSVRRVLQCIEHYEGASGQLLNRDKSGIILPKRFSTSQIRKLENLTGFRHQQQPFIYLGVPLFKEARKIFLYDDLVQKVRSRIFGWASRLLSFGGRISLIRSVLSSIPLYLLQIIKPPKAILKKLDGRLFRVIHWRGDLDITPLFGIFLTTQSLPPPVLVYWRTPPGGSYKINTDGCVKDGFASGGRVIRDSSSQCVRAFFSSYGECPILEAELRAIFDGIILAQRLVLSDLWIESDSTLVIHCIPRGGGPWSIQATLHHIRHHLTFDRDTISHIYREGNQVADLLASEG
ncbi:Retrotransposon [Abeliophyllum distichum]|uniref:Retrotransposon n=1 Tax=Abeliophyllum distichum TaxID=126358 RepID=A0ABD1U171_9LAMI